MARSSGESLIYASDDSVIVLESCSISGNVERIRISDSLDMLIHPEMENVYCMSICPTKSTSDVKPAKQFVIYGELLFGFAATYEKLRFPMLSLFNKVQELKTLATVVTFQLDMSQCERTISSRYRQVVHVESSDVTFNWDVFHPVVSSVFIR